MKDNTLPDLQARKDLTKFFFWTAWTASAERPNTNASYTNNWPHEPLINNVPTPENVVWSIASCGIPYCRYWFRCLDLVI